MSVFSDRRRLRQIGGMGAYFHQVAWSVWWRLATRSESQRLGFADGAPQMAPALIERDEGRRDRRPAA